MLLFQIHNVPNPAPETKTSYGWLFGIAVILLIGIVIVAKMKGIDTKEVILDPSKEVVAKPKTQDDPEEYPPIYFEDCAEIEEMTQAAIRDINMHKVVEKPIPALLVTYLKALIKEFCKFCPEEAKEFFRKKVGSGACENPGRWVDEFVARDFWEGE